jgi:hypothetical protein
MLRRLLFAALALCLLGSLPAKRAPQPPPAASASASSAPSFTGQHKLSAKGSGPLL